MQPLVLVSPVRLKKKAPNGFFVLTEKVVRIAETDT